MKAIAWLIFDRDFITSITSREGWEGSIRGETKDLHYYADASKIAEQVAFGLYCKELDSDVAHRPLLLFLNIRSPYLRSLTDLARVDVWFQWGNYARGSIKDWLIQQSLQPSRRSWQLINFTQIGRTRSQYTKSMMYLWTDEYKIHHV